MRVDLKGPVTLQAIQTPTTANKGQGGSKVVSPVADRTTLSSNTASVKALTTQAMQTAPVRQAKVDALKQSVQDGTYKLNPAKIAAAILDDQM